MRMETAATITSTTASMVIAGTAEAQKSMVIPLVSANTFRCLVDLIARCPYPESKIRMRNLYLLRVIRDLSGITLLEIFSRMG